MMYKTMNGHAQIIFNVFLLSITLITTWETLRENWLCQNRELIISVKWSFSYSGATLWNNLPSSLNNVGSVDQFKRSLKKVSSISDSHAAIM